MNNQDEPTYNWVDGHETREKEKSRVERGGSLWRHIPGIVYCGAIVLLSVILGIEISKLFAEQTVFLQLLGWGCVAVVGFSAISSYYAKGHIYKSHTQQALGVVFWILELVGLSIGLIVSIADAFGFSGQLLDVFRFMAFMSIIVAAFGWGIVQWASPEWKVIRTQNKTKSDLDIKLAEFDAQYAMSDEMVKIRMETARNNARREAMAASRGLPAPSSSQMLPSPYSVEPSASVEMPFLSIPQSSPVEANRHAERPIRDYLAERLGYTRQPGDNGQGTSPK